MGVPKNFALVSPMRHAMMQMKLSASLINNWLLQNALHKLLLKVAGPAEHNLSFSGNTDTNAGPG
jgi:hypothetical protein